jgi:riboflavin synthase
MFTGLIVDIGTVSAIRRNGSNSSITIQSQVITSDAQIGDSIAVNGACLTITGISGQRFTLDAVTETLKKTNLGDLSVADQVNLEPAIKVGSRLGGHFVQGHVDTTERIVDVTKKDGSWLFEIQYSAKHSKYLIPVGSIAVNGVSLTIAEKRSGTIVVSIIPHTFENTCFRSYSSGMVVNLEFDQIGKYVVGLMEEGGSAGSTGRLNSTTLESFGY